MFHFNFLHGPHTVGSDLKGITRVLSEVCASEIFEMEFGGDTCSTFNGNIHIGTCWCSIFVSCHCYNFIIWKIKKNLQFVQNCPYPWWKLFKILLSVLENWIISYDSKHLLYHKQIIKKRIIKILIYLSRNTTPNWHTHQAVSTELPPFKTQWTDLFLMRYLGTILWSFVDPHDVKTANCCRQMTSFFSSLHWWFLLPVRTRLAPFVYHQSAKHNIHMYNAWNKIISHVK